MEAWTTPQIVALAVALCLGIGAWGLRMSGYVNVPLGLSLVWTGAAGIVVTLAWVFFDLGVPSVLVMAGGVLLGLALILFSLRQSMGWYQRRQAKRKEAESQREARARQQRLEREWGPWAEPWVAFYCTAGLMMTALDRLHTAIQDGESPVPAHWQEILQLAKQALMEAAALHPQDRAVAERDLPHFIKLAEDGEDPNAEAIRRIEFGRYLFEREAHHYRNIRSKLGLPSALEAVIARRFTPLEDPPPTTAD